MASMKLFQLLELLLVKSDFSEGLKENCCVNDYLKNVDERILPC